MSYKNKLRKLESLNLYIIDNIDKFFRRIEINDDVIGIYVFFKYMVDHAFFTNNVLYSSIVSDDIKRMEERYFNLTNSGLLIPYGCSVCRHRTNFLYMIYNFLGYENSELFTYFPNLEIDVKILNKELSNVSISYIQDRVDELLESVDLFSTDNLDVYKEIDGILYKISYKASMLSEIESGNHVVNVVLDSSNNLHILDTMHGLVGSKILDKDVIRVYQTNNGFSHKQFIRKDILDMDSTKGEFLNVLRLMSDYPITDIDNEILRVKYFEEECKKRFKEFIVFKKDNINYYDDINRCVNSLISNSSKRKILIK